jgi:hypothetical protein
MSGKITVIPCVDADGHAKYAVSAYSLADLAKVLGVPEDRFVLGGDEELIRQERRRDLNRRLNTPEAIWQRTNRSF